MAFQFHFIFHFQGPKNDLEKHLLIVVISFAPLGYTLELSVKKNIKYNKHYEELYVYRYFYFVTFYHGISYVDVVKFKFKEMCIELPRTKKTILL